MSQIVTESSHVICELCGLEAEMLTHTHFKFKHNITFEEYRKLYPKSATITLSKQTERRNKISEKAKGRIPHNKGVAATELSKKKQSNVMKRKFASGELIHWNKGKHIPKETRDKIASSVSAAFHAMTQEERDATQSKRNIIRQKMVESGWVNPLKGVALTGDHLLKSRDAIAKASLVKSQHTWDDIEQKCVTYGLSIVDKTLDNYVHLKCNSCESEFSFHFQIFRNSKTIGHKICPTCYPRLTGSSGAEKEVAEYIKSLGMDVIENDRSILGFGMELDIYVPSKNIAIEYNGLYWRAEGINPLQRNVVNKTTRCNDKGIKLIHIFEDEWLFKQDIVKSRLRQIFKVQSNRLHARKLLIKKFLQKKGMIF